MWRLRLRRVALLCLNIRLHLFKGWRLYLQHPWNHLVNKLRSCPMTSIIMELARSTQRHLTHPSISKACPIISSTSGAPNHRLHLCNSSNNTLMIERNAFTPKPSLSIKDFLALLLLLVLSSGSRNSTSYTDLIRLKLTEWIMTMRGSITLISSSLSTITMSMLSTLNTWILPLLPITIGSTRIKNLSASKWTNTSRPCYTTASNKLDSSKKITLKWHMEGHLWRRACRSRFNNNNRCSKEDWLMTRKGFRHPYRRQSWRFREGKVRLISS